MPMARVRPLFSPWLSLLLPWLVAAFACVPAAPSAAGVPDSDESTIHPLAPADTSSPRATLESFRQTGDELFAHIRRHDSGPEFWPRVRRLATAAVSCLDLRDIAPLLAFSKGRQSAVFLKEVFDRIELPPSEAIPDAAAAAGLKRWRIPHTEIALIRIDAGPREGDWVFCSDAVERAEEFFEHVRHLPYRPDAGSPGFYEIYVTASGWMIPESWIRSLPPWARATWFDVSVWQWLAMVGILAAGMTVVAAVFCWSQRATAKGGWLAPHLAAFAAPTSLIVVCMAIDYMLTFQVRITGDVLFALKSGLRVAEFAGGILIVYALITRLSEVLIRSRRLRPGTIDIQLMRLGFRLLTFLVMAWMTLAAANYLGIPVAPLVAGLGVSGLALALAAQHTVENLIAGLVLFADKPVRIGDACQFEEFRGTVEEIGLRSTRIRGPDRSLISIPNSEFAKLKLVNLTQRDRLVFTALLPLPREIGGSQLRAVLASLRAVLGSHPHINHSTATVRIVGNGSESLDVEATAHADTSDGNAFATVHEELLLRLLDVIEAAGGTTAPQAAPAPEASAIARLRSAA